MNKYLTVILISIFQLTQVEESSASPSNVITVEIETEVQTQSNVPVIHPGVVIASLLGECPGAIVDTVGFRATVQQGEDVRNPGLDFKFSMASTLKDAVSVVTNGKPRDIRPMATICETVHEGNSMLHVSGGIQLYVVSLGGIVPRQRASARVSWEDELIIESDKDVQLEIPIHLQVNGLAAESLGGEKGDTFATVNASFSASADGISLGQGSMNIESVSVIPEQESIDLSATIPIDAKQGTQSISVKVQGTFEVEVQAKAVGLFSIIASSATGGVLLPGSFDIGHVQSSDGKELPKGIQVMSGRTGLNYQLAANNLIDPLELRIRLKQNTPWIEWDSEEGRNYQLEIWNESEWLEVGKVWKGTGKLISVQPETNEKVGSRFFRVQSW